MTAIHHGLQYVARLGNEHGTTIRLLTDSKSSLEKLATGPEAQDTALGMGIWQSLLQISNIRLIWVPSHCGLQQNEQADQAANEAAQLPQENRPTSLQTAKATIRRERVSKDKEFYGEYDEIRKIKSVRRNRWEEVTWNQFASGQSSLCMASLHKMGKAESDQCPDCGEPDTVAHVTSECQRGDRVRQEMTGEANPTYASVLTGGNLFKLLRKTGRSSIDTAVSQTGRL